VSAPTPVFLVDLKQQYRDLRTEIRAEVDRVCSDAAFILGADVARFEEEFAAFCDAAHAVGVASGLEALDLGLRAFGVGPGDEVIVPANTFVASVLAISRVGATPVLVDCTDDTLQIDPDGIEAAITPRTQAIMPVHLYGQAAPMDRVTALGKAHGLVVIEDAAQAHGARYQGRPCGSLGAAAAFSFYPGKNLGAYGDGGAVVTSDESAADYVRMARNYGQSRKYRHEIKGGNSRLDTLQAVVLRIKLRHLTEWTEARRRHAAYYDRELADLPVRVPVVAPENTHVFHLYVVRHPERDRILQHMADRGVHCGIHYPVPVHLQPAYADLGLGSGTFPVSEAAAAEVFSLPMYPELTTDQLARVCSELREYFGA
jgi:dTDP-4-amino-4,6-dideoxygalactose transaminase